MPEESKEQKEFTVDFLKGAISDAVAGTNGPLVKAFGDSINEFKNSLEETLKELKNPAERKAVGGVETGEGGPDYTGAPQPFESFGDQMLAVKHAAYAVKEGRQFDHPGLKAIGDFQRTKAIQGQNESNPMDGGILVQQDFKEEIMLLKHNENQVNPTVVQIGPNSNGFKTLALNEASRKDGQRNGGVRVYRTAEGMPTTKSQVKLRGVELKLKKLMGVIFNTDEMQEDAVAMSSLIPLLVAKEMNFVEVNEMINGDGADEMQGIVNSPSLVTVDHEDGQTKTVKPILYGNITTMYNRMYAPSRGSAVWNLEQDVEVPLMAMSLTVGTAGIPVYLPANGLSASPYANLMGRPIVPLEQCQGLGTKGDIMFNDWSQYLKAEKGGMKTATSMHVEFLTGQEVWRFTLRNDGRSWWNAPIESKNSTTKRSPFVTLSTRPA